MCLFCITKLPCISKLSVIPAPESIHYPIPAHEIFNGVFRKVSDRHNLTKGSGEGRENNTMKRWILVLVLVALSMLAIPGMAEWILTRSTDPEIGVTMTTYQVGSEEKPFAYFVLRIIGKQLACFIDAGYGSTVNYRFDSDNSYTNQMWNLSRSGTSLFYPGDCSKFLDRLRGSKKLEFQFQSSDTVSQTRTFNLTGFPMPQS